MSTNVLAEFQKAGDPGQLDLTIPVAPIEVTLTSKNKSILDKLRSKHEYYDVFHSKWAFYMDSFEGGEDFITEKNIFRHVRENIDDHRDRVDRAVYLNYVQPLVSFFSNFIFSEEIMRTGGTNAELYSKFTKDVDDQGNKMELFMKEVSDLTQIFGHVDILVDKKQVPVELRGADVRISKKQEEDLGLDKPYLVILYPEEVYDWNLVNGKFTYLKRCIKEKDIETYTEWFPEAVVITTVTRLDPKKETYSIKREVIENILKEVPIVRAYFKQSKKYKGMGISFLKDISYICRRIMNLSSLLDEFLYRQCYNFLAKETDSGVPLVDQNEGNQGTSNVMEYPRGGKAPQYVSPPVDPAEFLQSEIKSNILEIYRLASQDTALEAFTGQSRSGDAQVQSFHKVIPYIAIRAEGLEQTEIKLTKLWLKWIDPTLTWDGTIAYKNDYGILNVTQFLIQLKMLFSDIGIPSVTFVREEMKRIVQEFDGKISQENIKSIFSEIDKLVTEDYVQSMVAAKKSINNLKGVPGTTQIQQGTVQKTLGNNTLISAVGANKVVETRKDKESKNKNRTSNNNKSQ